MLNLTSLLGNANLPCHACNFPKGATMAAQYFDWTVIISALALILFLFFKDNKIVFKFFFAFWGATIFEFITQSMWQNYNLGEWAYITRDISWILGLGWATIVVFSVWLAEKVYTNKSELFRFFKSILVFCLWGGLYEYFGIISGVRQYSPEVKSILVGWNIPVLSLPIEALYFLPVTGMFLISFYHFWAQWMAKKPAVPSSNLDFKKSLMLSFAGVLLFDIMTRSMVQNVGFPQWAYIFGNINLILTLIGSLLLALTVYIIDSWFRGKNPYFRYTGYVYLSLLLAVPLELFMYVNKMRIYSADLTQSMTGIVLPFINVPIEVVVGTLLYVMLVVPFISYWSFTINRK